MGAKQHFSRPSSGRIDRSHRVKPPGAVRSALAMASGGTDAHNNRFNFDAELKPVTLPKLAWMATPKLPECPRESAALPLAQRMKAPSCAQYLTDLAAMGAGQPTKLRPSDMGSTISKGGPPPPAALAHHEQSAEPAGPLAAHCPARLDDG